MLTWNQLWNVHEPKISHLSATQKLNLCLAAIESCLELLGKQFLDSLSEDSRKLIPVGIDILWGRFEGKPCSHDELASLLAQLENRIMASYLYGEYGILIAIYTTLEDTSKSLPDDAVINVVWYVYNSVLQVEVLATLEREMTEDEVRILEVKNRKCMICIDKQLELLKAIQRNEIIPRKSIPG